MISLYINKYSVSGEITAHFVPMCSRPCFIGVEVLAPIKKSALIIMTMHSTRFGFLLYITDRPISALCAFDLKHCGGGGALFHFFLKKYFCSLDPLLQGAGGGGG